MPPLTLTLFYAYWSTTTACMPPLTTASLSRRRKNRSGGILKPSKQPSKKKKKKKRSRVFAILCPEISPRTGLFFAFFYMFRGAVCLSFCFLVVHPLLRGSRFYLLSSKAKLDKMGHHKLLSRDTYSTSHHNRWSSTEWLLLKRREAGFTFPSYCIIRRRSSTR